MWEIVENALKFIKITSENTGDIFSNEKINSKPPLTVEPWALLDSKRGISLENLLPFISDFMNTHSKKTKEKDVIHGKGQESKGGIYYKRPSEEKMRNYNKAFSVGLCP
jgi:hypothetical protein